MIGLRFHQEILILVDEQLGQDAMTDIMPSLDSRLMKTASLNLSLQLRHL